MIIFYYLWNYHKTRKISVLRVRIRQTARLEKWTLQYANENGFANKIDDISWPCHAISKKLQNHRPKKIPTQSCHVIGALKILLRYFVGSGPTYWNLNNNSYVSMYGISGRTKEHDLSRLPAEPRWSEGRKVKGGWLFRSAHFNFAMKMTKKFVIHVHMYGLVAGKRKQKATNETLRHCPKTWSNRLLNLN